MTSDSNGLAARERPKEPLRREYRAGMVVRYDGRRWEIEAVEFWESDEKLHLRELDGAGRVRTREEWARNVEFESDLSKAVTSRFCGNGCGAQVTFANGVTGPCPDCSQPAPAASWLPDLGLERIRLALLTAKAHAEPNCQGGGGFPALYQYILNALKDADTLEAWARSQATAHPVVGMTPELNWLLSFIEGYFEGNPLLFENVNNQILAKVAAVRAQAASAQPGRDLPKVREWMRLSKSDYSPAELQRAYALALAELDASAKTKAVPVEVNLSHRAERYKEADYPFSEEDCRED